MKFLLIALIRVYRLLISPLFPPSCRFQPTCSQYALDAVERFGAIRGSWMAIKRIYAVTPFIQGVMIPFPVVMIIDFSAISAISAIAFFLLYVNFKLLSNTQQPDLL